MCRSLGWVLSLLLLAGITAGCNLSAGTPTPFPTPDIPTVEFLYPANNSTVLEGIDLNIELLAADASAGIARVELLIDDQPHQEGRPQASSAVPTFTITMNWLAQGIGQHAFTAIAYRENGAASAPKTIIIEVVSKSET